MTHTAPAPVQSVLDLIGNTPIIQIHRIHQNPNIKIFAKLEGQNPGGSVKDRIALSLIETAEKNGELTPGKIILESTSGNTGIGLAMIAAVKGYKVLITLSSAMSEERKKMMRAFGAELIETDPTKGTAGAIEKAQEIYNENPQQYWMPNQHSNPANPEAHFRFTAEEIYQQVPDITHFVAGIGTFGTLRGTGAKLKQYNENIQIIGIEPKLGEAIQGIRNMQEPLAPELFDETKIDQKINVLQKDSFDIARRLAAEEGIFVGMSSGAALWGALEVAKNISSGNIVVVFPDRGEKYLSTALFS